MHDKLIAHKVEQTAPIKVKKSYQREAKKLLQGEDNCSTLGYGNWIVGHSSLRKLDKAGIKYEFSNK